ncbi:MAG: carboxymuconolactone decarboxylase family protein [Gammaproteobacteria bacterium]|nr:carboxymuconolactone decarboxylase family protein [Gammaproteobacteria bacterium]
MARMKPLPAGSVPEVADALSAFKNRMGFHANSLLTMQRRPNIVKALAALGDATVGEGTVDVGLKKMVGLMASYAAGCLYCQAHQADGSQFMGVDEAKISALFNYEKSALFTPAEKVALEFGLAGGSVPNGVTDELFLRLREHWDESQIVELLGVIGLFGFLNRWNDSMATDLEEAPTASGNKFLAEQGWESGKHGA